MASLPGGGGEALAIGKSRRRPLFACLRFGRLALVSYVVAIGTWTLLGPAPLAGRTVTPDRAAPAARGGPAGPATPLTVSVDGLAASLRATGTVGDALAGLGLPVPTDGLSSPADAALRPGHRILVDRGIPVTLLDGGRPMATRARGTVAELLSAERIDLGPLDLVDRAPSAKLSAGDVVRITRIADNEVTVLEDVPFGVRFLPDADLDRGTQLVVMPGQPGLVTKTYLVRVVDGQDVDRTFLASLELVAPVEEVRRLGVRSPRAPAEIEAIIREAAARNGADPEQLLRVAWCESRFNPSAYNASGASGLFQFMPRTWAANSVRAGYAGASPFDPVAAANVAAWMFARGSASLWSCR
ncbi:MAG TPA: transglycosylase SLT domain-containing protein [Candidatus Limnocylindria bacterium]|jgi:hypothetical protein|nr:transglycosylase SLT domain-containing protein [Candidatus Limnocylindria bacterium]